MAGDFGIACSLFRSHGGAAGGIEDHNGDPAFRSRHDPVIDKPDIASMDGRCRVLEGRR
jgi:hypothetical protein